jgi:AraC family transcriptional regulator
MEPRVATRPGPDQRSESTIPFRDARSGRSVAALPHTRILITSRTLSWPGLLVEAGRTEFWETDDVAPDGHYLAINLDDEPLSFERKGALGLERVVMPPDTIWLNPAGRPFRHRVRRPCHYGAVVLEPSLLERLLEVPGEELTLCYGREDPPLAHLVHGLLGEASREAPAGTLFAESMGAAIGAHLLAHYAARPMSSRRWRGGLGGARHRRLVDHVESNLGEELALTRLAEVVGVSPYHLSREFKRATGETLHRYVMRRRLERARQVLRRGERPISVVAQDLGFADQSHLTRLFRDRFGVTPAAFARTHRSRQVLVARPPQDSSRTARPFKKKQGRDH